jgi:DNA helicase-2/ATP-dependent DNA helicase PcrA
MRVLQNAGFPVHRRFSLRLVDRAHVRDVLALMAVDQNPENRLAWKRVFSLIPGIGDATIDGLMAAGMAEGTWSFLEQTPMPSIIPGRAKERFAAFRTLLFDLRGEGLVGRPVEWIERLLGIGYAETLRSRFGEAGLSRIRDLRTLAQVAQEHANPRAYLASLALGDPGPMDRAPTGITLSTIHQAKGLEWEVVYVIGLTEGIFPLGLAFSTPSAMSEERRLFYVASTRARQWLHWLSPTAPRGVVSSLPHPVSRFVAEINPAYYQSQESS